MIKGLQLDGKARAVATVTKIPGVVREESAVATRTTLARVVAIARARVKRVSGALAAAIDGSMSGSVGQAGLTNATFGASTPGGTITKLPFVYGPMVHWGSIHNPHPNPFMLDASTQAAPGYVKDMQAAGPRVEAKLRSGGRFS